MIPLVLSDTLLCRTYHLAMPQNPFKKQICTGYGPKMFGVRIVLWIKEAIKHGTLNHKFILSQLYHI